MIIAIAGKMGSGKDTGVNHLVENYNFKRMAFADNLKFMCMNVFGLSYDECFDEEMKFRPFGYKKERYWFWEKFYKTPITFKQRHAEGIINWAKEENHFPITDEMRSAIYRLIGIVKFETPRHVLQYVGTEILRNIIDEDYHAKVLYQDILSSGVENIAISDCRFPNERQKVKEWGGTTIIVTGRETDKAADDKSKSHASENSLGTISDYDFSISNTHTLETFYSNLDSIMLNEFKLIKSKKAA